MAFPKKFYGEHLFIQNFSHLPGPKTERPPQKANPGPFPPRPRRCQPGFNNFSPFSPPFCLPHFFPNTKSRILQTHFMSWLKEYGPMPQYLAYLILIELQQRNQSSPPSLLSPSKVSSSVPKESRFEVAESSRTFASISAKTSGFSFRYFLAFSRPWPIFSPL